MSWIRHRNPRRDELRPLTPKRTHTAWGDYFLVWDGEVVDVDYFEIPSETADTKPHSGYWHRTGVRAWQPLPTPPNNEEEEHHGASW